MPEIKAYEDKIPALGESQKAWDKLIGGIESEYVMDELWTEGKRESAYRDELKFRRGGKTLITLYMREDFFKVCIVLGKNEREKFEAAQAEFSDTIVQKYDETNTLHDGKWLGFDIYDDALIGDIIKLLHIKRRPNRKDK